MATTDKLQVVCEKFDSPCELKPINQVGGSIFQEPEQNTLPVTSSISSSTTKKPVRSKRGKSRKSTVRKPKSQVGFGKRKRRRISKPAATITAKRKRRSPKKKVKGRKRVGTSKRKHGFGKFPF